MAVPGQLPSRATARRWRRSSVSCRAPPGARASRAAAACGARTNRRPAPRAASSDGCPAARPSCDLGLLGFLHERPGLDRVRELALQEAVLVDVAVHVARL